MNTENCWFCDGQLVNEAVKWHNHNVHLGCTYNMSHEFLVISPITHERLERYVTMDKAEGISDMTEYYGQMEELIGHDIYIMGVGETPELDSYYGVMLPANSTKIIVTVMYDDGQGLSFANDIQAFINPENGQHYIHSSILF